MQPIVNVALRAARRAGQIITRNVDRIDELNVKEKTKNDLVSEIDRQAEVVIIDTINSYYPDHSILAEESGTDQKTSEFTWIIDPLDGTQDFVNRTGEFTILIGLVENHITVMGLVYLPTQKILYYGEKGLGAFCYNLEKWEKISVRDTSELQDCLALVSRHHLSDREKQLLEYLEISKTAQIGSTLKVMEVSAGRADIYLTTTTKMHQWDTAA